MSKQKKYLLRGNPLSSDDIQIDVEPLPDLGDIEKKINEELIKTAVNVQNRWQDNLSTGIGVGKHNGPYRDRGESVASIDIEVVGNEVSVFSDLIQVLIAEIGRMPGSMPPFKPISDWVHRKLKIRSTDPKHYPIVKKIQWNIYHNGLEGFAPLEKALADELVDLEQRLADASIPIYTQ